MKKLILILALIFVIGACEETVEQNNPERHWNECRARGWDEFRCAWVGGFGMAVAFPWQMMTNH